MSGTAVGKLLKLDEIAFNLKDLVYVVGAVWVVFEFYARFLALESGMLEVRMASINMELSYMEDRERTEREQRTYDSKKLLLDLLTAQHEELQ